MVIFFPQHNTSLLGINGFRLLNYFSPWLLVGVFLRFFVVVVGSFFSFLVMYWGNIHIHSCNLILVIAKSVITDQILYPTALLEI